MSVDRVLTVYTKSSQTGSAGVFTMDDESRYFGADEFALYDLGLYKTISSLRSYGAETPTTWLLFDGSCYGDFVQITNSSTYNFELPSAWGDRAQSIMGIRRDTDESIISIRDLFKATVDINGMIDEHLADAEKKGGVHSARRIDDFHLDCSAFPEDSGLDSRNVYPRLWFMFEVDVSTIFFKKYTVTVSLYLHFYIWHGILTGHIEAYDVFVEDGGIKGIVEAAVGSEIGVLANDVNKDLAVIGDKGLFSWREYKTVYHLPGSYSGWTGTAAKQGYGDSGDDCMLVLVPA